MYGVVTRNEEELTWAEWAHSFYEVKDVTGRSTDPVPDAINTISCFADNAAVDAEPGLVPQTESGVRATREQPYFDWDFVCPTHEEYQSGLLEIIDDCVAVSDDVRLDDVGFPRAEYCQCERCRTQFAESDYEEWDTWRTSVITDFIAQATDRIPGRTYLTLHPDPYPGALAQRAGIDLATIEDRGLVDEFVIPLYDTAYGTTYWLEIIASGFQRALETPMTIELYAVDIEIESLIHATEVADAYSSNVSFGYDASNGRAAIRRMEADKREGVTHGKPSEDSTK